MAQGDVPITLIGNLTADPELRYTPNGAAVANFTVASTPRTYNRQTGEWEDGETLFMRCSVWREQAENVAETLTRGSRVIVTGKLKSNSYETKEGEKRTGVQMEVDEVGPSMRYATAKITRNQRGDGNGNQNNNGGNNSRNNSNQNNNGGNNGGWGDGNNSGGGNNGGWDSGNGGNNQNSGGGNNGGWGGGDSGNSGGGGGDNGGWSTGPSYDEPPF